MALEAYALIEVNELQQMQGRDLNEDGLNTQQREQHINAASLQIGEYINRHVCPVASSTAEYFTGDNSISYLVRGCNIGSIASISQWTGSDWQEMTTASYPRTSNKRRIWFTRGHKFIEPSESFLYNYKLVYTTGYDRKSVPADLKRACVALVQRSMILAEKKEGFDSMNFGDVSVNINLNKEAFPDSVKGWLAPWMRRSFGTI